MTKIAVDKALLERLSNCKASEPEQLYYMQKELRAALAEPAVEPRNHVGNSKFDSWYSEYNASGKGDKQRARDAYAAGMGDPVYLPSPPPPAEPVLEDIEQYRLQMAGISTAAIGYWKVGDGILPEYDTVALRDVAKLYAKYDKLYKAAHKEPAVELSVDDSTVLLACQKLGQAFKESTPPPAFATRTAEVPLLTDEEIEQVDDSMCGEREFSKKFAREIEAAVRRKAGL